MTIEIIKLENYIFKLDKKWREYAEDLAKRKCDAKPEEIRDKNILHKDKNAEYPHCIGLAAEIAYSQLTGKPIDESISAKGDEMDFDGVEIKSATWLGSDIELKVDRDQFYRKTKAHIYVLARVSKNYDTVEFIGSTSRKRFEIEKYEKIHIKRVNYCVLPKSLKPMIPAIYGSHIKIFEL